MQLLRVSQSLCQQFVLLDSQDRVRLSLQRQQCSLWDLLRLTQVFFDRFEIVGLKHYLQSFQRKLPLKLFLKYHLLKSTLY